MDVPKFTVFETRFNNDELESEFHAFFYKNNLTALFTNEHRSSPITVTYLDAKAVVNTGGAYERPLKEFAEVLSMSNDNQMYEESIFRILEESRSFQAFVRKIKELTAYIKQVTENKKHNVWNIVWYNKDLA